MILPKVDELQQMLDGLMAAHKNYTQLAVRYIGRDDSVYEQLRADSKAIGKIGGWMTYIKESLERENELLD